MWSRSLAGVGSGERLCQRRLIAEQRVLPCGLHLLRGERRRVPETAHTIPEGTLVVFSSPGQWSAGSEHGGVGGEELPAGSSGKTRAPGVCAGSSTDQGTRKFSPSAAHGRRYQDRNAAPEIWRSLVHATHTRIVPFPLTSCVNNSLNVVTRTPPEDGDLLAGDQVFFA